MDAENRRSNQEVGIVEVVFTLRAEDELTKEQIKEIEAARDMPCVEDEDNPALDPQKTPELWNKAMEALAERNRRMAQRMA